jgi:hypothetical protein
MRLYLPSLLLLALTCSSCHHNASHAVTTPIDSLKLVDYAFSDVRKDSVLFAEAVEVGELTDSALSETSGIAPSNQNPGYFWTQQDSGNSNEIQLIDRQGTVVGEFELSGTTNRDWEDIAVGPGPVPGKSYVYVAEIGDNEFKHPVKIIYRFPEPTLSKASKPVRATVTGIETIRVKMPDGPKNAEAIMLDPGTLDLYVISKEEYTTVYKASYPQSLTAVTTMELTTIIPLDYMTAAAISPNGREILIRAYDELFYYTRRADESVEQALQRSPLMIPIVYESQGEAICWAPDGSGYYTTSEKTGLFARPIYFYRRK